MCKRVHARLMQKEAQLYQRRRAEKDAYQRVEAVKKFEIGAETTQFVIYVL